MTFQDDDTSAGRVTQGGRRPRGGGRAWAAILGAAIAIGAALFVVMGPHKPKQSAPAEANTTPVTTEAPAPSTPGTPTTP